MIDINPNLEAIKILLMMNQIIQCGYSKKGARQEAAKVGGIGSCGRELCCSTWLSDFKSVNTTAARYQNLSINQSKLSGQCGRLKCCLNYELDTYLDALQQFPDNADTLQVAKGTAILVKKDIFKNIMWYVLPDSSKQFPLTIERVIKIKKLNAQNTIPDELEPVEVATGKPKEEETGFVDLVGHRMSVSDDLLNGGEVVSTRGGMPTTTSAGMRAAAISRRRSIVVLINGGSASARRSSPARCRTITAPVIGTKSFGKGSVQTVIPLGGAAARCASPPRATTRRRAARSRRRASCRTSRWRRATKSS